MRLSHRSSSLLANLLAFQILVMPLPSASLVTDGSTLALERGAAVGMTPSTAPNATAAGDSTGAATTSVPIEVAPGPNGLQPRLTLRYSSHRARSDSWVGAGWGLSLGTISRALDRGVPTYDNTVDEFLLDGQKLVNLGVGFPGDWRTRRESFAEIRTVPGWEVRAKNGTATRYARTGNDLENNCAIQNPSPPVGGDVYFAYLLCEVEDVHGNQIRAFYAHVDPGVAYLDRIEYGTAGNRNRVVHFHLEDRPDHSVSYRAGFEQRMTKRLHAIEVEADGELIRRYELDYGGALGEGYRSLLRGVRHYGSDYDRQAGTPGPAPPRVWSFTYRDGGVLGWQEVDYQQWNLPNECRFVHPWGSDGGSRLGDLNGDGLPDLVSAAKWMEEFENDLTFSGAWLSTGSGFSPQNASEFELPVSTYYDSAAVELPPFPQVRNAFVRYEPGNKTHPMGMLLTDIDADGRSDLLVMHLNKTVIGSPDPSMRLRARHEYFRNTGAGWELKLSKLLGSNGAGYRVYPPHVTGSGGWATQAGPNLIYQWPKGQSVAGEALTNFHFSVRNLNTSPGAPDVGESVDGASVLADLDGDGRPEFVTRHFLLLGTPYHPPESGIGGFRETSFTAITESGNDYEPLVENRYTICSDPSPECSQESVANYHRFYWDFPQPDMNYGYWVLGGVLRNGKRLIDLNSDGLSDHLSAADPSLSAPFEARLNTGQDFGLPPTGAAWVLPPSVLIDGVENDISKDEGVRFADLNGDGRTDLIQSGAGFPNRVWLNTGDPNLGWDSEATLPLPVDMDLVAPDGTDAGVRLSDLNGDGMLDLIRCDEEADPDVKRAFLHQGRVPDLLETVTSPLGALSTIAYEPSTKPGQYLPQIYQVVSSLTVDDANGNVGTTNFQYENGLFDAEDREFRGFQTVRATRDDGRETVTSYHQDDERSGLIESIEVKDDAGTPWLRTDHTYTPDTDGPPYVSLLETTTRTEYEGGATPRRSKTEHSYGAFGNLELTTEFGEVDATGADLLPSDTRSREFIYTTPNAGDYVVDRPAQSRVWQGDPQTGVLHRETRFFYDDLPALGAEPTKGNLTQRIDVLDLGAGTGPTTTFSYDVHGNVRTITNPRENAGDGAGTREIDYDPVFQTFPVREENAEGHETLFDYEPSATCAIDYPAGAGLAHVISGPNALALGLPGDPAVTAASLRRCFDAFGRIDEEYAPGDLAISDRIYVDIPGSIQIWQVDQTNGTGGSRLTTRELDGLGREFRAAVLGPQGKNIVSELQYDSLGRVATRVEPHFQNDPLDPRQEIDFDYDWLDRPTQTTLPGAGRVFLQAYDSTEVGLVTTTDPSGGVTRQKIDPFGNVLRVEEDLDGNTHVTEYEYDVLNQLRFVWDHYDNQTEVRYDALGRRTRLEDPDAGLTTFDLYDANGNLRQQTNDPAGASRVIAWTYDALDRPLSRSVNAATDVIWAYDTSPGGIGLLQSRSDAAEAYEIDSYDLLGRPSSETLIAGGREHGFQTEYDLLGQVKSRGYPTGESIEWLRDAAGYVTGVNNGAGEDYATNVAWDARGGLSGWTTGGGATTASTFDPTTKRLDRIQVHDGGGTLREDLEFDYYADDQIWRILDGVDASRDRTFVYDDLNRLTEASGPYGAAQAPVTHHYRYDPIGNLTCRAATADDPACPGGTKLDYPLPGAPRPHTPATVGGLVVTYDPVGNIESLGGTRSYEYDDLGQLIRARESGLLVAEFAYDADGRLAERSGPGLATRFLITDDFEWNQTDLEGRVHVRLGGLTIATHTVAYNPGACAASPPIWPLLILWWGVGAAWLTRPREIEWVPARAAVAVGVSAAFVVVVSVPRPIGFARSAFAASPTGVTYYHADHLGSTVVLTDEAGAHLEQVTYRPYGEVVSAGGPGAAPEFGFTGQLFVESLGIYDYGARWYDPELGQFLQPDGLVPDPLNPQSLNRYSYVLNDPIGRIDPSGQTPIEVTLFGIGGDGTVYGTHYAIDFAAPITIPVFVPGPRSIALGDAVAGESPTFRFEIGPDPVQTTRLEFSSEDKRLDQLYAQESSILREISEIENSVDDLLREVFEVVRPTRIEEGVSSLPPSLRSTGRFVNTRALLSDINRIRERADPLLNRLESLDRKLYQTRTDQVGIRTRDYRAVNAFVESYVLPDRFGSFNSRLDAAIDAALGVPAR